VTASTPRSTARLLMVHPVRLRSSSPTSLCDVSRRRSPCGTSSPVCDGEAKRDAAIVGSPHLLRRADTPLLVARVPGACLSDYWLAGTIGDRSAARQSTGRGRARLASDLPSRVMSPGKHPPEGAQNGTMTPAVGRAAAAHGAHALDETPHDREEQIQPQDPPKLSVRPCRSRRC
jgi:hypothetical protein